LIVGARCPSGSARAHEASVRRRRRALADLLIFCSEIVFLHPTRDNPSMSTLAPAEVEVEQPHSDDEAEYDRPWTVIVWNDPINLMSYVTLVFQKLFGYSLAKATKLMLQVHNEGKAVVSSGNREKAELDVSRLHAHGLWATMQRD
jgi:ATP-dependent Clp protease adaptor protein ClpS